ncbi:hypothetical protein ACQ4M3_39510 [Leptolyngbya sp. AN03gr2]|uniref:hypothetical protein n=1 Tax=unclassified Leptolyngbya TaxID=2650499 RepID=UPI003D31E57D
MNWDSYIADLMRQHDRISRLEKISREEEIRTRYNPSYAPQAIRRIDLEIQRTQPENDRARRISRDIFGI